MDRLTNAAFAQQCAYLASEAARWSGDSLTLPEEWDRPIRPEDVARFTAGMRGRLDRLDAMAGVAALAERPGRT